MKAKTWLAVLALAVVFLMAGAPARAGVVWPKGMSDHGYLEVHASSNLPASKVGNYVADNVLDGQKETAWAEGAAGDGLGEWIQFNLSPGFVVTTIGIWNGYQKSAERYYQNARVKSATIIYADGSRQKIYLKDQVGVQTFNPKPGAAESIRIVIDEAYPGAKWPDTCISEVDVYLNVEQ
jgi:hypothetical protein